MTLSLALWFCLSVLCDVAGQLCFKLGARHLPDAVGAQAEKFWRGLVREPWLLVGVAVYTVEVFVWLRILSEAPLNVAFSIASLNFIGIVLASRFILKEPVGRARWLGALLVTFGVVLVAGST